MKKGFTLVELIGVIVVLGLISLIVVPSVTNSLKVNKKKLCKIQLTNIVEAAKVWGGDNLYSLPEIIGDTKTIALAELQANGYISDDVVNPVTKDKFSPDPVVTITKTSSGFDYQIDLDSQQVCE